MKKKKKKIVFSFKKNRYFAYLNVHHAFSMSTRYPRDKNASQIVFDITGGESQLRSMNLDTIPNRRPLLKPPSDNFVNRNDDIDGSRHVSRDVHVRDIMDTKDIDGSRPKPMYDSHKAPVDVMRLDDIDGSRPRVVREVPPSQRVLNPVDPQYDSSDGPYDWSKWSSALDERPGFIRDNMRNDDVDGASPASYRSDKPPKDLLRIDDIDGARPARRIRLMKDAVDTLDVRDINNDGIFKSSRVTDPLNPSYLYDGMMSKDDFGKPSPPLKPHNGPDRRFNLDDIPGASADCSTNRYKAFRRPQEISPDDEINDEKSDNILMVPSMKKQTLELERQNQARMLRSEKLRYYENRNLHAEYGTGDPIQGILRKQREARAYNRRVPTF